jgi:hypothetical protein
MAIEINVCAYCGVCTQTEEEHVVPECLAPAELRASCQWVTVRACSACNRGFSADESDFREFAVLAGSLNDNPVRNALFHGPVTRNWRRGNGRGEGARRRILEKIRKPDGSGLSSLDDLMNVGNLRIAPDDSMLRVMRKFIRGLYFHHFTEKRRLPQVLQESQIWVWPIFDPLPQAMQVLYELSDWHVIHSAVFGYTFAECEEAGLDIPGVDSIWLLDAFKGAVFQAVVVSNTFSLVGGLHE